MSNDEMFELAQEAGFGIQHRRQYEDTSYGMHVTWEKHIHGGWPETQKVMKLIQLAREYERKKIQEETNGRRGSGNEVVQMHELRR